MCTYGVGSGTITGTNETAPEVAGNELPRPDDSLVVAKEPLMPNDGIPPTHTQSPNIVILITGSRHAQYEPWANTIASAIWEHTQGQPYELVHGDARGIDRIAADVAGWTISSWGMTCKITAFPADWKAHGKAAGPRRNVLMRDYCESRQREGARIVCLAFHEDLASSKGTKHMVNIIQQLGGITLDVHDGKGGH